MNIKRSFVILFCITIVILSFPSMVFGQSATVVVSPSTASINKDSAFDIEVKLNLPEEVTAAKIYINFDNSKLTGQSIDVGGSAFTTAFPEAIFDNTLGIVKIQAAQNGPGVSGDVMLARIRFLATSAGTVILSLDPSSLLLTADDRNLLTSFGNLAAFNITTQVTSAAQGGGQSSGGGGGGGSSGGGGGSSGGGGGGSSGGGGGGGFSGGRCSKRGDVDCNGRVDIIDLSRLLASWKKGVAAADFNGNGIVDIVDLSILLSSWKK